MQNPEAKAQMRGAQADFHKARVEQALRAQQPL
jgi:hypothetical protein